MRALRRAFRSLAARPLLHAALVLTLGVGVGLNLGLLGIVRGLYFQERDVPAAHRLLWIGVYGDGPAAEPAEPALVGLLGEGGSWDASGGWDGHQASVAPGSGAAVRRWVRQVTPGFHQLLGVAPARGRGLVAADTLAGAPPVALVSHGYAVAWLGGPDEALGADLEIDGTAHRVVGILPREWQAGEFGVTTPLRLSTAEAAGRRIRTVVRLRNGVDPARAREELLGLAARLSREPGAAPLRLRVGKEKEILRDPRWLRAAITPFVLTGILLLVTCTNLAGVLLGRAMERRPTLVLQRMLGAGRWALLRPLLLESLVLATLSVLVATGLAWVGFQTALSMFSGPDAPRLDLGLVVAAASLGGLVVLVGGCLPAVVGTRVRAAEALRSGGSAVAGDRGAAARGLEGVVALQMALALPLVLTSAGLGYHAVEQNRVGVGYDPSGLVEATLPAAALGSATTLLETVRAQPGVAAAGILTVHALTGDEPLRVEGQLSTPTLARPAPRAPRLVTVTPSAFATLGVTLVRGRWPSDSELRAGTPVAVVNEAAERVLFGGTAVARRVQPLVDGEPGPWLTVVGVVGDIRDQPLFQSEAPPAIYSGLPAREGSGAATLVVRASSGVQGAARALERALAAQLGTDAPDVHFTARRVREETRGPRLAALMGAAGAAFALLLAVVGLWAITTMAGARRQVELGVRASLGAGPGALTGTVLMRVAPAAAGGTGLGVGLWWLLHDLLEGIVDAAATPAPVVAAAALLFAALVFATTIPPALRAARQDPVRALRSS